MPSRTCHATSDAPIVRTDMNMFMMLMMGQTNNMQQNYRRFCIYHSDIDDNESM